jgi:hypothetical protein
MQSSMLFPIQRSVGRAVGIRSVAQSGAINTELGLWIGSGVLAILGLVKAVHSAQPFLWLAIWPAPVTLLSTIFIFLSQGFHFRNGVLVLGRRSPKRKISRQGAKEEALEIPGEVMRPSMGAHATPPERDKSDNRLGEKNS